MQDKLENYCCSYYLVITYDIMFPIIKGCWHVGQRSICCSTWQCSSKSLSMLSPFLTFCKSHGLTNESKQKMSHSYIPWMSHIVLVLIELLCKFWIRYGNQWIEITCENPKMKKIYHGPFNNEPHRYFVFRFILTSCCENKLCSIEQFIQMMKGQNNFSKSILQVFLLGVSSTFTYIY